MVQPSLPPIKAYLERTHTDGPERQARFNLVGTQVKLGRGYNNDFVLPFFNVSKNHAEFQLRNAQWEVRNLALGGIWINHEHIEHDEFVVLTNNDVISFVPDDHSVVYRFVSCENFQSDNEQAAGQSMQSLQTSVPGPSTSQTSISSSPGRASGRKRTEVESVETLILGSNKVPKLCDGSGFDADNTQMLAPRVLSTTASCLEYSSNHKEATGNNGSQEKFIHLLDSELSCAICNEVVIEASAGSCGDIFCSHCIAVWIKQCKKQSNPNCPSCQHLIGSPTRLRSLDKFISRIFDFVSNETRENREQILNQRQQQREKWETKQNSLQPEPDRVQNQVEKESREDIPEPGGVPVNPAAASDHREEAFARNSNKNVRNKRRKRRHNRARELELLFVPVLEGCSTTVAINRAQDHYRVKHSQGNQRTVHLLGPVNDSAENNHVPQPNTNKEAPSAVEAPASVQQSRNNRAPLNDAENDWFQAHQFIFRMEESNGGRLTKKGLNLVKLHIRKFLWAHYGLPSASTSTPQGHNRSETEVDGVPKYHGSESNYLELVCKTVPLNMTGSALGNFAVPVVARRSKSHRVVAKPVAWEIRSINIPPLVFPRRPAADAAVPHHIVFAEIERLSFGEPDFPRSPASGHHLVPSPAPSLASNVSVWSDVFASAGEELGAIDPASPLQFIPDDLFGEGQTEAGLEGYDDLGVVDQHEPLSQSLQDEADNAILPALVDESPPFGTSLALPTFAHPEEHNRRAVSPPLSDRRLEFSVIPPTYTPGVTPQYKIIGKLVYNSSDTSV